MCFVLGVSVIHDMPWRTKHRWRSLFLCCAGAGIRDPNISQSFYLWINFSFQFNHELPGKLQAYDCTISNFKRHFLVSEHRIKWRLKNNSEKDTLSFCWKFILVLRDILVPEDNLFGQQVLWIVLWKEILLPNGSYVIYPSS